MSNSNIAIIGGGPAGLLLARLFHLASISYTVFELASSPSVTIDGGTLDLHEATGQAALKAAGLHEEFTKLARTEGEAVRFSDPTGYLYVDDPGTGDRNKPEIDRQDLRKIMLAAIPSETVSWGKKVKTVSKSEHGKWYIEFVDGSQRGGFDLVVGADGAWSRIRTLLTDVKPFYSGITNIEFRVPDADRRKPAQAAFVGKGSYYAFGLGSNSMLGGQRNTNGSVRPLPLVKVPETWVEDCGINWKNASEAKEQITKEFFSTWSKGQQEFLMGADDDYVWPRKLYMLPVGLEWEGIPGVTVVGDAAHLMTPFAGVGVNIALQDSWELSKKIVGAMEKGEDLHEAVRRYEKAMFVRAKENAELSWKQLQSAWSANALDEFKI